jgi:signal transduction histidine kinase
VEDLLDLARIDAGAMQISKHRLELPALLDFTLHSLSPQATNKLPAVIKADPTTTTSVI